jgi:hypothetical protein
MKESEAKKIVAMLIAAFPYAKLSPETPDVYATMLVDLPAVPAALVAKELIASSRFFPTIAEIREVVAALRVGAPASEEAWAEVLTSFSRVGRYRSPTFSHPLISKTVDCLGWQTMCDSENPESTRARFLEAYSSQVRRTQHEEQVRGVLPPLEERRRLAQLPEEPTAARIGGPTPVGASVARLVGVVGADGTDGWRPPEQ